MVCVFPEAALSQYTLDLDRTHRFYFDHRHVFKNEVLKRSLYGFIYRNDVKFWSVIVKRNSVGVFFAKVLCFVS